MLALLRTLLTIFGVAAAVCFAFTVPLGRHTFAEHVDRIGETREAKALLEGTRERVNPALDEAKQRVLGEYLEAPTAIHAAPPAAPARVEEDGASVSLAASTPAKSRLPGRR